MADLQTLIHPGYFEPLKWDDFSKETPKDYQDKIDFAHDLGVAAIYFMPDAVTSVVEAMGSIEYQRLRAIEEAGGDTEKIMYIQVLGGAVPFASEFQRHICTLKPYVHLNTGYVRKSRYEEGLFGEDADPTVKDLITDKELAEIEEIVIVDDVREEGKTAIMVDDHLDERMLQLTGHHIKRRRFYTLGDKQMTVAVNRRPMPFMTGLILPVPFATQMGLNTGNKFRWAGGVGMSRDQLTINRPFVEKVIKVMGKRVVIDIDDFNWITPEPKAA